MLNFFSNQRYSSLKEAFCDDLFVGEYNCKQFLLWIVHKKNSHIIFAIEIYSYINRFH